MKKVLTTSLIALVSLTALLFLFWGNNNLTKKSVPVFVKEGIEAVAASLDRKEKTEAHILFVGDIMFSRQIAKIAENKNDKEYPFGMIRKKLKEADLVVANLENPVSDGGVLSGSIYSFRAKPEVVTQLVDNNIKVVSLANNHIWDYGRGAFFDTMENLEKAGVLYSGIGESVSKAHTPVVISNKGTKIAFLSYTDIAPSFLSEKDSVPAVAFPDPETIKEDIIQAKTVADIVVVMFHWGEEYFTIHNLSQEYFAHLTIDAGADLVIGHHPHVPQEVEMYKGKYIAYSLGNFIFDQNFSLDTGRGLMLDVSVVDGKITGAKPIAIKFSPQFEPFLVSQI